MKLLIQKNVKIYADSETHYVITTAKLDKLDIMGNFFVVSTGNTYRFDIFLMYI